MFSGIFCCLVLLTAVAVELGDCQDEDLNQTVVNQTFGEPSGNLDVHTTAQMPSKVAKKCLGNWTGEDCTVCGLPLPRTCTGEFELKLHMGLPKAWSGFSLGLRLNGKEVEPESTDERDGLIDLTYALSRHLNSARYYWDMLASRGNVKLECQPTENFTLRANLFDFFNFENCANILGFMHIKCKSDYYGRNCDLHCPSDGDYRCADHEGELWTSASPEICKKMNRVGPKCDCLTDTGRYTCSAAGKRQCEGDWSGQDCDYCKMTVTSVCNGTTLFENRI